MIDLRNPEYLARGTDRQRELYRVVVGSGVLDSLADYDPVIVSSHCVGLDLPDSDIDLACEAPDLAAFEAQVSERLGTRPGWESGRGEGHVLLRFEHEAWLFEIYASELPVEEQNAWRHLCVHARLLEIGGDRLESKVLALKRQGFGTEPAMAAALGFDFDDPYAELLSWYELSLEELAAQVQGPRGESPAAISSGPI